MVLLAAVLAVYPAVGADAFRRLLLLLGVGGVAAVGIGALVPWPPAVGWGLAAIVAEYGVSLIGRDGIDPGAPLFVAAVVLVAEVSFELLELRRSDRVSARAASYGWMRIVGVTAGSVLASGAVLILLAVDLPHGPALQAVAIGAAAALFGAIVVLVQRRA